MAIPTYTGTVECPECFGEIELKGVMSNQIVQCPDCGVDYEVISVDPIALDFAPKTEEDYGE